MNIAINIVAGIGLWFLGSLAMLGLLVWRSRRIRARRFAELCDAMERHPAGRASFAFRARPCGHLLFSPTLDVIDMEHREFDHVLSCPVVEGLLANRKDDAA